LKLETSMNPGDYLSTDDGPAEVLLTLEGVPQDDLSKDSVAALAALAAAVNSNAHRLSPEQLEQAVRWLKRWKAAKQDMPPRQGDEFSLLVKRNRELSEQVALQSRAYRLSWVSRLAFLAAVVVGLTSVGTFLGEASPWAWISLGLLAVLALVASDAAYVKSTKASKEQEQRNLWKSVRLARSVGELNTAGLFAYLPGTTWGVGERFDDRVSKHAQKAEAERLSDALYR
jgi:hypothetical protein